MTEKITINPERLEWCLANFNLDLSALAKRLNISRRTLEEANHSQAALTLNQLEKLAVFFGRGLLFFTNPEKVQATKIHSPQFRTLNNQKTNLSISVKKLIERVERQRKVFLALLEDLEEPITTRWHIYKLVRPRMVSIAEPRSPHQAQNVSIDEFTKRIRNWLKLNQKNDFDSIRQQVQNKGIMVILTTGYRGKWQIDRAEQIAGFSLYYEKMPIIVVKKEASKARQSFTLLHELGHLLLHHTSRIDEKADFYESGYDDTERQANEFAGKVLIPDSFLAQIDLNKLQKLAVSQYDSYLNDFKKDWGASCQAIMLRLLLSKNIDRKFYAAYVNFKKQNNQAKKGTGGKRFRHTEPLHIFGAPYVKTVFDAFQNQHIALSKVSTYLDSLKIDQLKNLQNVL